MPSRLGSLPAGTCFCLCLLLACSGGGSSSRGDGDVPVAPHVIQMAPAPGETGVALATQISATFSEDMDPASFTSGTFVVSSALGPVAGTVNYAARTATFTPHDQLPAGTTCTVNLSSGIRNAAGTATAQQASWSFSTLTPPVWSDPAQVGVTYVDFLKVHP